MQKRIYIIYTGGTIGMIRTPDGYAPAPGYLAEQIAVLPELAGAPMPEVRIHEYSPLLDSADMAPVDWSKIAGDIADHYEQYDGFIVLHGTDTMAYTASALPFLLQNLRKPVILTGSQIPLCEIRSDARSNLVTALLIAANYAIPEVCLFFGQHLLRGCRAVKVSADGFEAFASPNLPPLGEIGVEIKINWDFVRPAPPAGSALQVHRLKQVNVGALRLWPGIPAGALRNFLQPPLEGMILEAYGVGNGPANNRDFLAALKEANERGVVIVDCTQCLRGRVHLDGYATGSALLKAGVISGLDLTAGAALAKLSYLFSRDLPVAEVKRLMQVDLCGELTAERPD